MYNLTPEQLQYAAKLRSISNRFMTQAAKEFRSNKNENKEAISILKELAKDKSIHITRPDKGKGVVILSHEDYVNKMLEVLNDSSTFKSLDIDPTIKKENKLIKQLLRMVDRKFITENEYKRIRPCGSLCARMYGLPKIHKVGLPLRPVVSSIDGFNYRLSKYLAKKLQPFRKNKYMVKDTFDFIESIKKINRNMTKHRMISFDVTSLFTKIPLSYTINLILNKLYGPEHTCPQFIKDTSDWCSKCLDRHDMNQLLITATSDTHFSFNNEYYVQTNGVAMGSPLAPVFADIFLIDLENKLMKKLKKAGLLWYKRYVDDTFAIIHKNAKISKIKKILNNFHKDIQFSSVQERNNELPFLDVLVHRRSKKLETSVYRKPIYTGLMTKWSSLVLKRYKISAVSSMIYRTIRISSSFEIMHKEFDFIRDITERNGHPSNFVEYQIRCTLNRYMNRKNENTKKEDKTENKEQNNSVTDRIVINIPYMGKATQQLSKDIKKIARKIKPTTQVTIVERPPPAIRQMFQNKDKISKNLQSNIIYQVNCSSCSASYVGKTNRQACRRLKEHRAPSNTLIQSKNNNLRRSERIAVLNAKK